MERTLGEKRAMQCCFQKELKKNKINCLLWGFIYIFIKNNPTLSVISLLMMYAVKMAVCCLGSQEGRPCAFILLLPYLMQQIQGMHQSLIKTYHVEA